MFFADLDSNSYSVVCLFFVSLVRVFSMVYTVTIDSRKEFTETTLAACKALVAGLECGWTIHSSMMEHGARHTIGIVKGCYGNQSPMAFCLGSNFSVRKSMELLKSFKRSRIEKDANNTTYVSAQQFLSRKNLEKQLELCGF